MQIDQVCEDWDINKDGKITWIEFREGMNKW